MIKYSIVTNHVYTQMVESLTIREMADVLKDLEYPAAYTPGVFRNNHREKKNFISAQTLTFDLDEGLPSNEREAEILVVDSLMPYLHIVEQSRSHMKEKNGKPAVPRYHATVVMEEPCQEGNLYEAIYRGFIKTLPYPVDLSCVDCSRQFFPCQDILSVQERGKYVEPRPDLAAHATKKVLPAANPARGMLGRDTVGFIKFGSRGGNNMPWHNQFIKSALDLKQNLFTEDEAQKLLANASPEGRLDVEDLRQLRDVYEKRAVYPPRLIGTIQSQLYERTPSDKRYEGYQKSKELRTASEKAAVTFIDGKFDGTFKLGMGFTLVASCSNGGKTTTAANIIAKFYKDSERDAFVVCNESSAEDIVTRVACIMLKKNWVKFRSGKLRSEENFLIDEMVKCLLSRIEIVDCDKWDMTCLEQVVAVLESAVKYDIGLVLIDYIQTVVRSENHPELNQYEVSKKFGLFLKDYGRRVAVPVVAMAQLYPLPHGTKEPHLSTRVQNDKQLFNHAFNVIEVVPNFEEETTEFIIHKVRYGAKPLKPLKMKWVFGRFEDVDYQPLPEDREGREHV